MAVIEFKPTTKFTAVMDADTANLVNKFVAFNQHTRNSHGPLTVDKLVRMLLEDVALSTKYESEPSAGGAYMGMLLQEHGYRTGSIA
jgi:hypothetical protein